MRGTTQHSINLPSAPAGGLAENVSPLGPPISPPYVLTPRPSNASNVTPMLLSISTACAVTPSPQLLSLGKCARSSNKTSTPALARQCAAADPAGPAPAMTTSAALNDRSNLAEDSAHLLGCVVKMRRDTNAGLRTVV